MRYFLAHWRGTLPLGISLWVNLVGLTFLVCLVELFLISRLTDFPAQLFRFTIISLLVTRLVIFPWQLVGLFRAAENNFIEHGNILKLRAVQLLGVLMILFTLVYSLEVIQSMMVYKRQLSLEVDASSLPEYVLSIDEHGQQLKITGGLDYGISKAVESFLDVNPGVTSVVLSSPGGQIYEGRGLARLFIQKQLDTYVFEECSSACATAFVGGVNRYLGSQGKLGFHQYKMDRARFKKAVMFFDPVKEQQRDRALFESRGVDEVFLNVMFQEHADAIWFPPQQALLEARVVLSVLSE